MRVVEKRGTKRKSQIIREGNSSLQNREDPLESGIKRNNSLIYRLRIGKNNPIKITSEKLIHLLEIPKKPMKLAF